MLSLNRRVVDIYKRHRGIVGPLSLVSLQVAAKALETGVFGAYFNVLINLKDMTDDAFKEKVGRGKT